MGTVIAVCTSPEKGHAEDRCERSGFYRGFRDRGRRPCGKVAPSGKPLSYDKIRAFQERGARVGHGAFGENLVVEGIDFRTPSGGNETGLR